MASVGSDESVPPSGCTTETAAASAPVTTEAYEPVTSTDEENAAGDISSAKRGAWVRYRIEHRNRFTGELLGQRETVEPSLSIEDSSQIPVFDIITTYKLSPDLFTKQESSATAMPIGVATPPLITMRVHSPAIVHALRAIVKYYPSQDLFGDIVIPKPFPVLVHHYEELCAYRDHCASVPAEEQCIREKDAPEHIGLLLKYLDETVMPGVRQEQERNQRGFETFEYGWLRKRPGITVLSTSTEDKYWKPGVIYSVTGGSFSYPQRGWTTEYWDLRFEGEYLQRRRETLTTDPFEGESRIADDEYLFDIDALERGDVPKPVLEQVEYGKKYWELLRGKCCHHTGKTLDIPANEVNGLVMADPKTYFEEHSRFATMDDGDVHSWTSDCNCLVCQKRAERPNTLTGFEDYTRAALNPDSQEELTEHQYFLCPQTTQVFVFKTRAWERVHVNNLSEPQFDETLIHSLVMDDKRKRTLMSLAKSFARVNKHGSQMTREPWAADFVSGKGGGLIFLLHGSPGVGKTCTAECIAAFTKRPLMVLTASDIGIDARAAEYNLIRKFKVAKRWGAVLLIDEADVYMEERSSKDLRRNSLVAAFLRALEFYEGILFLTTNRVGAFDDAFISRVHIQIYYSKFTEEERQKVWKTFIDKLVRERGDYMRLNMDAKEYIRGGEMRKLEWNGREIRNAIQTAVSLAEHDAEKDEEGRILVTDEHLRAVVELAQDFKDYLDELHGGDESTRSAKKYERLDSYDGTPSRQPKRI